MIGPRMVKEVLSSLLLPSFGEKEQMHREDGRFPGHNKPLADQCSRSPEQLCALATLPRGLSPYSGNSHSQGEQTPGLSALA